MAISSRPAYIFDSGLQVSAQGSLALNAETGVYTFSETQATIEQGEIGTVQVALILPLATFSGGTPLVLFRRQDGYVSGLLTMSTANWVIRVDGVQAQYQVLYITMSAVGWTYTAGRHALQASYLYVDGSYDKIDLVYYTVDDGINNYEEVTADTYEEIATQFNTTYADLLDRMSYLEIFALNGLGYNETGSQTSIPFIKFYNASGLATISFDGTNFILNRNSVDEEVMTVLNNLADLANVIETNLATNDILIYNGTNYVNITKTAFLAALSTRVDNADAAILLRELISNKVTDIGSTSTDTEYPSAKASYTAIKDLFKDVSYAAATGILTFTRFDNTTVTVDLPLELIIESGYYDAVNNDIVLVLANASEIKIPADDLLTDLDAVNVRYDNTDSGLTATNTKAAIDEVKEDITELETSLAQKILNYKGTLNQKEFFELGTLSSTTGEETTTTTRIRTKYYIRDSAVVVIPSGLKSMILSYDKDLNYITTSGWFNNISKVDNIGGFVKVIIARTNDTVILESEIETILSGVLIKSDLIRSEDLLDDVVSSTKITPRVSNNYILGTTPVNVNFSLGRIELPPTIDIFYQNKRITKSSISPVIFGGTNPRRVFLYDTKADSFAVIDYNVDSITENQIILGVLRVPSKQAIIHGEYTVDGKKALSDGKAKNLSENFSDVFYRFDAPTITLNNIVFPGGMRIYTYGSDLGFPQQTDIPQPNLTFDWNHNTNIVWDLDWNQIKRVVYPNTIENGIVLFKNIDGKLVGGVLKLQYEMESVRTLNDNKIYKSIGKTLAKTNITKTGTPNGGTVMGNEYWAFQASNDENTDYADCHRWLINEETLELTHLGSFQHNWGHVNSADYCVETDTLICGNGSGSYVLSGKIFIFENASSFKEMSQVTLIDNAIIIDIGMTYGVKVNVVWGNDNDGRYDVAHVITNDNKNITRIQLGKGTNDLGLGDFVSGKSLNEFNGSYKVLKTWSQLDGGDVVQGADYGDDGFLYVGLGHSGAWYTKQWLNDNGSINGEVSKTLFINQDGTTNSGFTQSVSEYKDKLILRIVKDGSHWAYVINK